MRSGMCCHSSGVSMAGGLEEGLWSWRDEEERPRSRRHVCVGMGPGDHRGGAAEAEKWERRGVCGAGVGRRLSQDSIFPSLLALLALLPSPLLTSHVLPVREPHLPTPWLREQCKCWRRPQTSHHLRLIAYRTPHLQNRAQRTRRSTGRAVVE